MEYVDTLHQESLGNIGLPDTFHATKKSKIRIGMEKNMSLEEILTEWKFEGKKFEQPEKI